MGWIILSSISGAIVAYAVTKVMCIKFNTRQHCMLMPMRSQYDF